MEYGNRFGYLKVFSYGVMHLAVAVAVAYAVSRNWHVALGIGILEPAVQTIAYTIHEKTWARTHAKSPSHPPRRHFFCRPLREG